MQNSEVPPLRYASAMKKNIALSVAAVLLALLLLEGGLRVYLTHYGDQRQKVLYLYSRDEISALKSLYRGQAFLNYGLSPLRDDVNSLGYRGPEIALPKPDHVYRIVALGGSTTYGIYLDRWQDAYPHKLQQALTEAHGYQDIEVINAGVPGYTSWESAVNLMLRIPDLKPDMVIVYHGVNDINPRLSAPQHYDGLNSGRGTWIDYAEPLPASVLYRYMMSKLGRDIKVT